MLGMHGILGRMSERLRPAQVPPPTAQEEFVGRVVEADEAGRWAGVRLERGTLQQGEHVHLRGPDLDVEFDVQRMREGGQELTGAHRGQTVHILGSNSVRRRPGAGRVRPRGAKVFVVHDPYREEAMRAARVMPPP